MKTFTILIISIFISTLAVSQNNQPEQNAVGPKIEFEKVSHNFGDIVEGEYATHKFKLYNRGDRPLVLKTVKPSCGCTASDYPKEPIMPGDSATIVAKFNSRGYGGRSFHKSITVTTNMSENNVKVLYIKGNVKMQPSNQTPPPPQSPVRINDN